MRTVDLNADLGESYGPWRMGRDDELLELVTSANIACGFHAGDPDVMAETVRLASARGVAIGAHPALPDRQGFGRRNMAISPSEAHNLVLYQLGALEGFVRANGARLAHVKPHGALYNQAAGDRSLADAVAAAVRAFDPGLILVGLAGSCLIDAGLAAGLRVAREGFADRRYEVDGSLTPRSRSDAVMHDPAEAVAQVVNMVVKNTVITRDGAPIPITVDTICLHGDTAEAVLFAQRLRAELKTRGIVPEALGGRSRAAWTV
ncbi:LamB/YcsF family protein [Methylococcus sp. EFPC2]|nr:LamB/YcsF family protein [Methylococcus sp. EFPC2]